MQFTGKERDAETGLDYFGARYFSGPQGRFTSADPSGISIDRTNPQSWNRYAYTYNTPLKLVDRNGMWPSPTHDEIYHQALPGLPAVQLALVQRASRRV